MPRKKKPSLKPAGPLQKLLRRLLNEENVSQRQLAHIAGCSPSVIHGWLAGADPSGTISCLKKLCNHYGISLSLALTGEPDHLPNDLSSPFNIFDEQEYFDGYARIRIMRLIPRAPITKG